MARSLRDALRVSPGDPVDLAALDPRATPLAPGGKNKTAAAMAADGAELARLQEALARLADPDKHWKFNEGDLAERKRWADYQEAYRIALERCSTPSARALTKAPSPPN
jgi:Polyphosphate kinase 2 (PPK2)